MLPRVWTDVRTVEREIQPAVGALAPMLREREINVLAAARRRGGQSEELVDVVVDAPWQLAWIGAVAQGLQYGLVFG